MSTYDDVAANVATRAHVAGLPPLPRHVLREYVRLVIEHIGMEGDFEGEDDLEPASP